MLEINAWFFVHLINFLALLVLLNVILFKPMRSMMTRREDHVQGSLNSAQAMDKEKETHMQEIEKRLAEMREKAKKMSEKLTQEGLLSQNEFVVKAHQHASELARKAKEDLNKEVTKTKKALREDVESFSKMIVDKMLGI
jgi:F-type H+-transporting ATPase subunit b